MANEVEALVKAGYDYQQVVREHRKLSADRPAGSFLAYPKSFTDHMAVLLDKRKRCTDALIAAAMNLPPQRSRSTENGRHVTKKPIKPLTKRATSKDT